jgi:hypothetical protein
VRSAGIRYLFCGIEPVEIDPLVSWLGGGGGTPHESFFFINPFLLKKVLMLWKFIIGGYKLVGGAIKVSPSPQ